MARFAHIALLALVAFAGAASASRGLKQNPGEALGLVMGDVLRGVAAGRPYTPGPLPSPFDASTNLANNLEALGLPNPLKDINAFAAALGLPSSEWLNCAALGRGPAQCPCQRRESAREAVQLAGARNSTGLLQL